MSEQKSAAPKAKARAPFPAEADLPTWAAELDVVGAKGQARPTL